jgi:hypothetical protein
VRALFLTCLLVSSGACRGPRSEPAPVPPPAPEPASAPSWRFLSAKYDADGDGRIARAEYTRSAQGFVRLDADGDGWIAPADFDARFDGVPRSEAEEFVWGEGGPEVGDPAPPFELVTTAGETIALSSFTGKKPVALVFGSFT